MILVYTYLFHLYNLWLVVSPYYVKTFWVNSEIMRYNSPWTLDWHFTSHLLLMDIYIHNIPNTFPTCDQRLFVEIEFKKSDLIQWCRVTVLHCSFMCCPFHSGSRLWWIVSHLGQLCMGTGYYCQAMSVFLLELSSF